MSLVLCCISHNHLKELREHSYEWVEYKGMGTHWWEGMLGNPAQRMAPEPGRASEGLGEGARWSWLCRMMWEHSSEWPSKRVRQKQWTVCWLLLVLHRINSKRILRGKVSLWTRVIGKDFTQEVDHALALKMSKLWIDRTPERVFHGLRCSSSKGMTLGASVTVSWSPWPECELFWVWENMVILIRNQEV